jgi:hypothetical protein
MSISGMATDINGDIYLFTSDDPSESRSFFYKQIIHFERIYI